MTPRFDRLGRLPRWELSTYSEESSTVSEAGAMFILAASVGLFVGVVAALVLGGRRG